MDIYVLLDQLEQLVNSSRKIRFSNKVMVDEDELLDLLDQLRTAVPDELRQAKRMLTEREKILSNAHAEADRLVHQAQEDASNIIENDKVVAAAQAQADMLLAQARESAEAVKVGADEYAVEVLRSLEQMMSNFLGHVRNGLAELEADRKPEEALARRNGGS